MAERNTGTGDQAKNPEDRAIKRRAKKAQKKKVVEGTGRAVGLVNGILSILDRF